MWLDTLRSSGLQDRVVGLALDEELYPRLLGGAFDGDEAVKRMPLDPFARLNALHERMNDLARQVKQVFPDIPLGHVTTAWSTRQDWGPGYYAPPVAGFDWLGIDPYVYGAITRAAFDRDVVPLVDETCRQGKPVLLVAQAFSDAERRMPTVEQMQWWADLADTRPAIIGLVWFCLDMPSSAPADTGLTRHPAQLAAAQWYARYCGVVPTEGFA
jgi:hypothetical protein